MSADKTAPDDSSVTELPLNIDVLRRYSRQQRQEITSSLRKSARESSDQAFTSTARGLCTSVDDETALAWGPKVTAAKDMSLTPEEAECRCVNSCGSRQSGARITTPRRFRNIRRKRPKPQCARRSNRNRRKRTASPKRRSPASARSCRIFVSDEIVRSVTGGTRVRHGGGLLAADNGWLREVKVWRAGEKDKPTSEYGAVRDLVTRWSRAVKPK